MGSWPPYDRTVPRTDSSSSDSTDQPAWLDLGVCVPPENGDTWVGLSEVSLPVGDALEWAHQPHCGAVVLFSGVARDHSAGRPEVEVLEYEAYEAQVAPRLNALADEARVRWPSVGRIVMLHRIGRLAIGDSAVVVVAAAPHRPDAFAAARFGIDALKATIPIWKREKWSSGDNWGLEAQHIVDTDDLSAAEVQPDGSVILTPGHADNAADA